MNPWWSSDAPVIICEERGNCHYHSQNTKIIAYWNSWVNSPTIFSIGSHVGSLLWWISDVISWPHQVKCPLVDSMPCHNYGMGISPRNGDWETQTWFLESAPSSLIYRLSRQPGNGGKVLEKFVTLFVTLEQCTCHHILHIKRICSFRSNECTL